MPSASMSSRTAVQGCMSVIANINEARTQLRFEKVPERRLAKIKDKAKPQAGHRYRGLGAEGLKELYDHTLPREVKRMLKPFGLACETVEVYVPENFKIRRIEGGFEVRTPQDMVLAVTATFREARDLLPDGAHERLYAVHGVRLSKATRAAILEKGFSAWG